MGAWLGSGAKKSVALVVLGIAIPAYFFLCSGSDVLEMHVGDVVECILTLL